MITWDEDTVSFERFYWTLPKHSQVTDVEQPSNTVTVTKKWVLNSFWHIFMVFQLVITFTDDQHRLQFAAEYSNDVKRLEKFLTSKMRSYCDYVDE